MMKNLVYLLCCACLLSCNNTPTPGTTTASGDSAVVAPATTASKDATWIAGFRTLRDAIYQHDKATVKTFFDFPVQLEMETLTEAAFDQRFDSIFSKHFVNTLLKVKSEELYSKGMYETVAFQDGSSLTYRMYASFNPADSTLTLNLDTDTIHLDENGEQMDGGEFNIIYEFVVHQGRLVFKRLVFAG
jgi:hypothetical protein